MKKLIILLFFVGVYHSAFAQIKPIYFIGDEITPDSTKATSYAIYGKLSSEDLWLVKRYDLYNSLLVTGSFKDDKLKIPHGKFTYYEYVDVFNNQNNTFFNLKGKTRFISGDGNFVNGKKDGQWHTYYPDGKVFTSLTFLNDQLNGEFIKYNKNGTVESKGNYVNDKKDGEWIFYSGLQKSVYALDTLKSTLKDKKLIRKQYLNPDY